MLNGPSADAATLVSKGLPSTIKVDVSYRSISYHKTQSFVITVKHGEATRGTQRVPIGVVTNFLAAIEQPRYATPSLDNLGMTTDWLVAQRGSALGSYYERYADPVRLDANQEAYFLAAFSDPRTATAWMSDWSSGQELRLDDYPVAKVRLDWPDGTSYELASESWFVLMLPWLVGPDKVEDFNADISRSIASLLPPDAIDHQRLAGDTLSAEYTDWLVQSHLRDQLDLIRGEDIFDGQLSAVEKSFTIVGMSNGAISSDDLNDVKNLLNIQSIQPSLQLHLQNHSQPSDVSVYMSLWSRGDKLNGVPEAVSAANSYTTLALSVPWLSSFLKQHQDWSAEIRVVQNRSITPQLAESLLSDLRDHGKAKLADMLRPLLLKTTFLYLNGPQGAYSRLFVLPDRRMLLWNYKVTTPFLRSIKEMQEWDWYGHRGVGVLFSPEGRVL